MLRHRAPIVSFALAAVCVSIFGLQVFWGSGEPVMAATRMGALIPSKVFAGDWWRLFSVMLLHGSFLHLALNMLALLSFGPFLEKLIGSPRYLLLFVLSGLGGSVLSIMRGTEIIGVGASGGIWGLMVAGAVVVTWPRGLLPPELAAQMRQRAWTPVAINLVYSLQPGIDMRAHIGGGVVGGLLVFLLTSAASQNQPLRPSTGFRFAAVVVGLLLAVSFGIALADGRPWQLRKPGSFSSRVQEAVNAAPTTRAQSQPPAVEPRPRHPRCENSPGNHPRETAHQTKQTTRAPARRMAPAPQARMESPAHELRDPSDLRSYGGR